MKSLVTGEAGCIGSVVVSDLSSAHLLALDRLGCDEAPERLVCHLGSTHGFNVREVIVIAIVSKVTGHKIEVDECPRLNGDPVVLAASFRQDQARTALGMKIVKAGRYHRQCLVMAARATARI